MLEEYKQHNAAKIKFEYEAALAQDDSPEWKILCDIILEYNQQCDRLCEKAYEAYLKGEYAKS